MKRTLFTLILILTLVSTLYISNTFAQDYTQWELPESAEARLGKGWINDIAYSQDSTRFAVASSIGIWIYDANTYTEIALLTGHTERVNAVAFSPDSKMLISGSHDNTVRLWNVETGELLHTLEDHTDYVLAVAFSPDGNKFASSDGDFTIRLWDTHTNQVLHTLIPNDGFVYRSNEAFWVYDIAFSIDGKTLASADRNNRVRLWDVDTGELLLYMGVGGQGWGAKAVAYSSDGVTLASGDGSGYVQLWGARTGEHWQTVGYHRYGVNSVAFSPDGNILASGGNDNRLILWDAFTGEQLRTLEGHNNGILGITFSPDGNTIVSVSWTEIKLWDPNTGVNLHTIQGHTRSVNSATFSPDGNLLASGDSGDRLMLWNPHSGKLVHTFLGNMTTVRAVAFSPDGNILASGHRGQLKEDHHVKLWDVLSRRELETIDEHSYSSTGFSEDWGVFSVAFSPDGNTLASGGGGYFYLWDVKTGERRQRLAPEGSGIVYSISFSPDGQTLVSAYASDRWDTGSIDLWLPRTGRRLRNIYKDHSYAATFSPDGSIIAGSVGDNVQFWNSRSGEKLMTLTGHTGVITDISFSPDGQTIASGSSDTTVQLWDVATGTLQNTLTGHTGPVYSVAFSPDGNTLATGSFDGTVLLWELTPTTAPLTFTPNTIADQTFEVGSPVNVTLPIATGGTEPYTYTLAPDLPAGLQFDTINPGIGGTPTTSMPSTLYTYTVTDAAGQTASLTFTIEVTAGRLDVNGNGKVNVLDLVLVAAAYGERGDGLPADVNADGIVNIQDLIAVAAGIDASGATLPQAVKEALLTAAAEVEVLEAIAESPMVFSTSEQAFAAGIIYSNVANALADAKHLAPSDVRLGKWIPLLEELLQVLAEIATIPQTTALLPNYPNPFNPETWIPYQLSKPADVTVSIYAADGKLVRTLDLGHQPVGLYKSRNRAAYWDGRNAFGEPVSSGVYFYTLTADEFTATRKMLIRK